MAINRILLFKLISRFFALIIIIFFMAQAGRWWPLSVIDRLENIAYDIRLRLTMPNTIDQRIVIIDIDEQSLAQEGRWPWPRNKVAELTNKLFEDYRVGVLAFDVVFSEPDDSSGMYWFNYLAENELLDDKAFQKAFTALKPRLDYDRIFADSIKERPVVLSYFFSNRANSTGPNHELPKPLAAAGTFSQYVPSANGFGGNLSTLQQAAAGAGFFDNPLLDDDGVFRRVPLLTDYQSELYEALSLAIYRRYRATDYVDFVISPEDSILEGIGILDYLIPTDAHSAVLVPYRGRQGSFSYYSASDILQGKIDRRVLVGKIAIVGTTAAGLMDLRNTPVQKAYPGVEVHANVVSALLDRTVKSKPAYMPGVEMLEILFLGIIASVLWSRRSLLVGALVLFGLAATVITTNLMLWQRFHIDSLLLTPLLFLTLLFIAQVMSAYVLEIWRKKQLGKHFSQYIPAELVRRMAQSDEEFSLGGESRDMSVLFTDVRGFTSISEGLEPKALSHLMNEILSPITGVIHHNNGTIDKYMGDAVMAFWGAPLKNNDHAEQAVAAALALIPALDEVNRQFKTKGWPDIEIGVGVNSGKMSVGNMGSSFRVAYTVLGDSVNLGSRLEGLTKQYGVPIIVGEETKQLAPQFLYRELDRVRVKGKQEPITIYQPLGLMEEIDESVMAELDSLGNALLNYRQGDWPGAQQLFQRLADDNPEVLLYRLYLQRIAHYQTELPPEGWDGVFTHDSK